MNTNHTPGPYSVRPYTPGCDENGDPFEPQYEVRTEREQIACGIQVEADAQLIAAAPELLAALEALANEYGPHTGRMAVDSPRRALWFQARAAITKATQGGE